MRKIIVLEWITLDGFFAGADGGVDWMVWGAEVVEYAKEIYATADTVLYGKTTYEGMKNHWTTAASAGEDPEIVDFMNRTHKIVFSKSLEKADWQNSELVREIDPAEIAALKERPGRDILLLGSGSVVSRLAKTGLIDEYKFLVNPVVLGRGKTLFQSIENSVKLEHSSTETFSNGNVLLCYRPDKKRADNEES